MFSVSRYKYSLLYLLSIVLVTGFFKFYPALITLWEGVQFSPWTILVGCWFVLRDFSQRELGHYVFIPMVLGVAVSTAISPAMGLASVLASIASEFADWAVYTFTKKPFHKRILFSSLISAPIDTLVFFSLFDLLGVIPGVTIFNWATVIIATLSKLIAALAIYLYYKKYAPQEVAP